MLGRATTTRTLTRPQPAADTLAGDATGDQPDAPPFGAAVLGAGTR